jgi:hypothetical protein
MNRIISAVITAPALICGVLLPRKEAVARLAKALVKTRTLISLTLGLDGKRADFFWANPQGQLFYEATVVLST